jgi:outer membrane protein assembly factor BamB
MIGRLRTGIVLFVAITGSSCAFGGVPPSPPSSQPTFAGTAPATAGGWPTSHRDGSRSGFDSTGSTFRTVYRAWRSPDLDGHVYAEPLVIGDRVFVATESNSVYALDTATGKQVWRTHLGTPMPGGSLPCGDIDPVGITGTPVADSGSGLIWVVPFVKPGQYQLVALDLATGAVRWRRSIDPPGADPLALGQRAALAFSSRTVYVAFGGRLGDCGAYTGWVIGIKSDGGGALLTYRANNNGRAGIWGPSGPAIDAAGDLYVATGNGNSVRTFDYGNAVIRLSPDLRILDWFGPANWADLNTYDVDLGSLGPAFVGNGLVFQAGKEGTGYLLRADHLGGVGGQVFAAHVCDGAWGGTAYAAPFVYVGCSDGLVALRLSSGASFSIVWRTQGFWAEPPIVTNGLVWTVARAASVLAAYDPTNGQERFHQLLGGANHFTTPSASAGKIFVAAGRTIIAFSGSS